MVCHARATARRLDIAGFAALDLLELFAFVRPARFCVPTPRGLAVALGLAAPESLRRKLASRSPPRRAPCSRSSARRPTRTPAPSPRPPSAPAGPGARRCWRRCRRPTSGARWGCAPGRRWTNGPSARRRRRPATSRSAPPRRAARLAAAASAWAPRRPPAAGRDYAAAVVADAFLPREHPDQPQAVLARGRDRGRQDAQPGYIAAGEPVGREEPGHGVDLDLYPATCRPQDRRRASTGSIPTRCRSGGASSSAKAARTSSAC